ncbi:MAG TPA: TonB-dependent receptor plug domain-containing protein [Allosphingosinicella sp.]
MSCTLFLLLLGSASAADAGAGDVAEPGTILITAAPAEDRVLPPATGLQAEALAERQPRSVAEALRGLPGVSARTNSRGETIARVRGADERQTQIFLDGAPLAVPWDGRADIGIVPAGLFGEVLVVKGAAPIEYGPNAVAGVVDLRTRSGEEPLLEATARAGTLGLREGSFVAGGPVGDFALVGAAAGFTRDAESASGLSGLGGSDRRTNTDADAGALFGAVGYASGPFTGRALLLHHAARRGIAPESPADASLVSPRYWRYPNIALTQLILASNLALGGKSALRLVGWRQWFGQTIDQYSDPSYTRRTARQEDEDDTFGGRATLSAPLAPLTLRLSATAQTSRHAQADTPLPSAAPGPELLYRQNLFSLGAEADLPLGPADATVGLAYDRSETPLTGDKPAQAALAAIAFSAAVRTRLGRGLDLTLSGGRRTRFPTPRELYGEALGRFLLNPDLAPETAWLADAELGWALPGLRVVVNPFLARSDDTLSQRVVQAGGRSLRQRFNLPGSWSYGVDAALTAALARGFALELFGTFLRARSDEAGGAPRRLIQRPSYEAGGAIEYEPSDAFSLRAEVRRSGPAIDLAGDGSIVRLPPGTHLDLRARHRLARLGNGRRLSVTAAADNLLGGTITPQLGLPLAGRSLRIGLRLD